MTPSRVATLLRKELTDTLRDRGTAVTVLLIPLVLYPALFLVSGLLHRRAFLEEERLVANVAWRDGPDDLRAALEADAKLRMRPSRDPEGDIRSGRAHAALVLVPGGEVTRDREGPLPVVIEYDEANRLSIKARDLLVQALNRYERAVVAARLADRSLHPMLATPLEIGKRSVTSEARLGGFLVGNLVPYLLVVILYVAAMNTATDITAGEKERRTIDTLLVTSARRSEIAIAKLLAVVIIGMLGATVALVGLVAVLYSGFATVTSVRGVHLALAPLPLLAVLLTLFPTAFLFGAVLLAIGTSARSVKEGHSYAGYALVAVALLGMVSVVRRGAEPAALHFWIPITNTTLVQQELLIGTVDWGHLATLVLTTAVLATAALSFAVTSFSDERILSR